MILGDYRDMVPPIINKPLLESFRQKERCEYCGLVVSTWQGSTLEPHHHPQRRGMSGGTRLDIPLNLIALCSRGPRGCHQRFHAGEILGFDLLAIIAAREGVLQTDIEDTIRWLLMPPHRRPQL